MVFQTAPPQPYSKARWICAPLLVGGAYASQKGLGERMPAKSMLRSAMVGLRDGRVGQGGGCGGLVRAAGDGTVRRYV